MERNVEKKLVAFFTGRDMLCIGEGPFKIDQRQVILHQNIPDVGHREIDIVVVLLQHRTEDVFSVVIVSADGKVTRAGNGNDG